MCFLFSKLIFKLYISPFSFIVLSLLERLTTVYKDLTIGKKTFPDLHKTIQPCLIQCEDEKPHLLTLFALLLDIICKLNGKGCSLTVTESIVNISEKLTSLLGLFVREKSESNSEFSSDDDDLPECTWTANTKLVCVFMVMCPLWAFLADKNNSSDVFAHRVELSEQVEKFMKILKTLRTSLWSGSNFIENQNSEVDLMFLFYKLFGMYSLLGFMLVLLTNCFSGEAASCSGIDLTRKVYSKDHLKTFLNYGGCDFIVFVVVSLNKILSSKNLNSEIENLLKTRATFVLNATGHLVLSFKKALTSLCKPEKKKMSFSLGVLDTSLSSVQRRYETSSSRCLNQTPGSSSEEEWQEQNTSSVNVCRNHSSKGDSSNSIF